jgi:hypothetical protein
MQVDVWIERLRNHPHEAQTLDNFCARLKSLI